MSINRTTEEIDKIINNFEDAISPDDGCLLGCNSNPVKRIKDVFEINSYFNLKNKLYIDHTNNLCIKAELKCLSICSVIKLMIDFLLGCSIFFIIVLGFFNWEYSKINFDEWPLIVNGTNLTHYYENEDDIKAINYYTSNIQGKIPNLADILVWMIFSGINISLTIFSTSVFSVFSLFLNVSLSIYELFTISMNLIRIQWIENWNPSNKYVCVLEYVQLTALPFSVFSGICNMMVRAYSLNSLTSNPNNIQSLIPNGFFCNCILTLFFNILQRYITIFIKISDVLTEILNLVLFCMIPYTLCTVVFAHFYIYYIIIMLLLIPFIVYPLQLVTQLILIIINCFKSILFCCCKKKNFQVDLSILLERDQDGNVKLKIVELNNNTNNERKVDAYLNLLQRRIIYLLLYVNYVNVRYLLNGVSIISINKIFFGIPNLSFSYYSPVYLMIRDYAWQIYELLIRLSTLI